MIHRGPLQPLPCCEFVVLGGSVGTRQEGRASGKSPGKGAGLVPKNAGQREPEAERRRGEGGRLLQEASDIWACLELAGLPLTASPLL